MKIPFLLLLGCLALASARADTPVEGNSLNIRPPSSGSNSVTGPASGAVGSSNYVTGSGSLAIGNNAYSLGNLSLIVGASNELRGGERSVLIGNHNGAYAGGGFDSLVVGISNCYGSNLPNTSVIIGTYNATDSSYVPPYNSTDSLIVGNYNTASVVSGLVSGLNNYATGQQFVLGTGLIANDTSQMAVVVGQYNKTTPPTGKKFLFVVGNGDSTSVRTNALEVTKDGTVRVGKISGDILAGEFQ